ncbi:MAG: hypothetical protein B6241_03540 [Spirochaetaceae bacterium 4572_59]|nr:MAG: hypothetical protein B6241_03540 [Spirochaetaceae bacterium 4572_59]
MKKNIINSAIYLLLMLGALIIIYPIFLMILNSLKSNTDFMRSVFSFPEKLVFENYPIAWKQGGFFRSLINSLFLTTISVIILLSFGSLAAYPISRKDIPGKTLIYILFLSGLMIPAQVIAIPLFILERNLMLLNTFTGLIFVYIATQLPIAIFILVGFMAAIPKELEEAATIDGCSNFISFSRIIFPMLKPAIATVTILTSLNIWNDFFIPLILLSSQKKMTVNLRLHAFQGYHRVDYTTLFAFIASMIIPIIILFIIMQKNIMKGMTEGAVKA